MPTDQERLRAAIDYLDGNFDEGTVSGIPIDTVIDVAMERAKETVRLVVGAPIEAAAMTAWVDGFETGYTIRDQEAT